jgi:glycosyltransferase involved in cell wall biosynthesis
LQNDDLLKIIAVIPLYNKKSTIERAVQSVLAQSSFLELLVVNDGSTDASEAVLTSLNQEHITIISQVNAGVSAARNAGIRYAKIHGYTHVAFLDADDYWKPDHIKNISQLIAQFPAAQIVANAYEIKQFDNRFKKAVYTSLPNDGPQLLQYFFEHHYLNSILNASNSCFTCAVFDDIGLFNTAYSHGEDTDLFIRAGIACNVAFNPSVTVVVDRTAIDRSARIAMNLRNIFNLDVYEKQSQEVPGLKKYLDLNRFSLSLAYRLENDIKNAAAYKQKVDPKNLSKKQNSLLEMSTTQLKALKKTQEILGKLGWYLRTGK